MNESINGYETREDLIRHHWDRYGFHWDMKAVGPRLKIPIRHRIYPLVPTDAESLADQNPVNDTLEFSFERGELNGRPAYRVLCEGIVVEEGPLK